MNKVNFNLKSSFVAAVLILLGGYNSWVAVIGAFVVLTVSDDEWLKRMMVHLMVVLAMFFGISILLNIVNESVSLLNRIGNIPSTFLYITRSVVSLVEDVYMIVMAYKAYKEEVFSMGFIEKIVYAVYQKEIGRENSPKHCSQCGNILNEKDTFCRKCGAKQ